MIEVHNESHWINADYTTAFKICDVCWCNISTVLMFYDCSSKCTQIFYWCHLATNTLQSWTECIFRAALVSALININFILFDMVSQTFLAKIVAILGSFAHLQSISNFIVFACFENISKGKYMYLTFMVIIIWVIEIPNFDSPSPWLILSK